MHANAALSLTQNRQSPANENALSRVVSDFFDPHGIHGQEPLFMNELLSAIGMPRVGVRDVVRVK